MGPHHTPRKKKGQRSDGRVLAIEGRRGSWSPRPFRVLGHRVALFDREPFRGVEPRLANAFAVESVDYRWERGRFLNPPADA